MLSHDDIARRAALRLTTMHSNLPAQVEAQLHGGKPGQYDPATAIALAGLLISAAQFAWQVYRDLKKDKASPSSDVIARKVRLQIALPTDISEAQRDQIIATIVDEVVAAGER